MTEIIGNTREAFDIAIDLERYGYEFYTAFARIIDDQNGKALMTFLANAEREHEAAFKNLRDTSASIKINESISIVDPGSVFPVQRIGEVDATEATAQAIEVEAKTAGFYRRCADSVDDPVLRELFERLVEEELKHKEILEDNLRSLRDEGSWTGYLPILEG